MQGQAPGWNSDLNRHDSDLKHGLDMFGFGNRGLQKSQQRGLTKFPAAPKLALAPGAGGGAVGRAALRQPLGGSRRL